MGYVEGVLLTLPEIITGSWKVGHPLFCPPPNCLILISELLRTTPVISSYP